MNPYRPLGSTGLDCHRLGFGCYRVQSGNAEHEAALREYLQRGGNLIDTSANYGDGASEELVGQVIEGARRDDVILVTKGGYMQGRNLALAQQRRFPEVVQYGPGIWHSIHPEFLATQIDASLARLKQDHLDIYLLHNPEYYLEDVAHSRRITAEDHTEFYRRVRQAFAYLEDQVAAGKVRWYGISSNNFGLPASGDRTTATSVQRCWQEAQALSGDHHFRVIQLPLNLYEPGGALEPNNDRRAVLDFCAARRQGVLANRPLNAFFNNQMLRLADWTLPGSAPPGMDDFRKWVEPLALHEQSFEDQFGEPVAVGGTRVSDLVVRFLAQIESSSQFERLVGVRLIEPIQAWLVQSHERHGEDANFSVWRKKFVETINQVFGEAQRYSAAQQQTQSDLIRQRLLAAGYPVPGRSLSQMALHVLTGLPGLTCALVGMRRREYVADAMAIMELEELEGVAILEKFNSLST